MKCATAKREIAGTSFFPPSVGRVCTVRGYYTGDFIGRVEEVDRCVVRLTVLDPLRPHVNRGCPFPQCIAEAEHDGPHLFAKLSLGAQVEVSWRLAKFELHPIGAKRDNVLQFPSRGAA